MAENKEVMPDNGVVPPSPTKDTKDIYGNADPVSTSSTQDQAHMYPEEDYRREKRPWWSGFFEMGHVLQIITAALLAIAIGVAVGSTTTVPDSARTIIAIPGMLWLRCLQAIGKLSMCRPLEEAFADQLFIRSHPLDCVRHDSCRPATARHGR